MPAMKTSSLFQILLLFPIANCLILPIQFSLGRKCNHQGIFKSIQCHYDGLEVYSLVTFHPTDNPQDQHTDIRLLLDTGSWETWLVTNNTKFMNEMGVQMTWTEEFDSMIPELNYIPEETADLNITQNPIYLDEDSLLIRAYRNHQLEFSQLNDERMMVPMDLYFAEEYRISIISLPLTNHGILGLTLGIDPTVMADPGLTVDLDNIFLHKFHQSYPENQPIMSFDINWNEGTTQVSCFGLGESLPIKDNLLRHITLQSFSDRWSILVTYTYEILIASYAYNSTLLSLALINKKSLKCEVMFAKDHSAMLSMNFCSFSIFLLTFSLSDSLILPLLLSSNSENCDQQTNFKSIPCIYSGIALYIMVMFGPIDNPQLRYPARLLVDTGSSETWLLTNATKLLSPNGTERKWRDISQINMITYSPQATNRLNIQEVSSYGDGAAVLLQAFTNQQLEFYPSNVKDGLKVPIEMYFAEKYLVPDVNIPLKDHGMLALRLSRTPKNVNNLFLYRFNEAHSNSSSFMSFDVNWEDGILRPSSLALGEALPIKDNLVSREPVTLSSFSDEWSLRFVSYMQLKLPSGKCVIIKPTTEYKEDDNGKMVYLNTTGIDYFVAQVDSGMTNIKLSDYFLEQLNTKDKEPFEKNFTFNCGRYKQLLPEISLGFENLNLDTIEITIPANKLYRRGRHPQTCFSLLKALTSEGINLEEFIFLGLPFFASVYIELHWQNTINLQNWDGMDFNAKVILGQK